jgi:hypothetical protein
VLIRLITLEWLLVRRLQAFSFLLKTAKTTKTSLPFPESSALWSSLAFTEWATTAQGREKWHRLATKPPFDIGKPFLRQPRGDIRTTPENRRLAIACRAAEVKERRALFAANANASADTPTNNPLFEIHRGPRAAHATHSEISGALDTTPCGGAPHKESWRRQTSTKGFKDSTHTQAPRDTRACPPHPTAL